MLSRRLYILCTDGGFLVFTDSVSNKIRSFESYCSPQSSLGYYHCGGTHFCISHAISCSVVVQGYNGLF